MTLELTAAVDARGVDVEFFVADGEKVALLGPNGSGKSTLLSVIAGLIRPDRGRAVLDGRVLFDLDEGRRVWRPAHARPVGLLAQDALLFPHLSVLENVAFSPRSRRVPKARARDIARQWLAEVDAAEFAARKPGQLSGGQAQRIAIARALAADPALLLLDEPMAALDVTVVSSVRQLLRRVLADRATIIVTHDVLDALLLADRVVVFEHGRIVEQGPTAELLARPTSAFGAHIAGLNLIAGIAGDVAAGEPVAVRAADGPTLTGMVPPDADPPTKGEPAVAVFNPGSASIRLRPPAEAGLRNVVAATVVELEPLGAQIRVHAVTPQGHRFATDVTTAAVAELDLAPGTQVYLTVTAAEVSVYPARPRQRPGR